jgi:ATP phosphoribosyltransferase
MLSLALPKGSSLERRTLDLFAKAGLEIQRPNDKVYRAVIDHEDPIKAVFYKPREIPRVVESGIFDFGLTGTDWIEEAAAKVETVTTFSYSKNSDMPWRVVLAVPDEDAARMADDLPSGVRVATEYVNIGRRYFEEVGLRAEMVQSFGVTEAKIPELAEAIIDVVETGTALRQNGLRPIATVRVCFPQLIASPSALRDATKRQNIRNIAQMLEAARQVAR